MSSRSVTAGAPLVAAVVVLCAGCRGPRIEDYTEARGAGAGGQLLGEQDVPLVTIDGVPLTLADLERRVAALSDLAKTRVSSATGRLEMLSSLVLVRVLAAEARAVGLSADPTVEMAVESALAEVVRDRIAAEQVPAEPVNEEEIRQIYDRTPYRYDRERELGVRLLLVSDRARATGLAEELRAAMADLALAARATTFEAWVAEREEQGDIRGYDAGALGFLTVAQLVDLLGEEVVASLTESESAGTVNGPYSVPEGWVLVFVETRRDAISSPLAAVAASIRERELERRRRAGISDWLASARAEADVEIDAEAYQILEQPPDPLIAPGSGGAQLWVDEAEWHRQLTPRFDIPALWDWLSGAEGGLPEPSPTGGENE